ncbi:MAG: S8 family serine peptidase [Acidimicrobiales bacterium]
MYGSMLGPGDRPDGDDGARWDQAGVDWKAVLAHDEVAIHVDEGGRSSLHRRDVLVVATEDLNDERLVANLRDIGVDDDQHRKEAERANGAGLGFGTLRLGNRLGVVDATVFLRSLDGRRPLRVGPDHLLWPMQARGMFPASPPVPAPSGAAARRARQRVVDNCGDAEVRVAVLDTGVVAGATGHDPLLARCVVASEDDSLWDASAGALRHWVGAHGTFAAGVLAAASEGVARIDMRDLCHALPGGPPLVADTALATVLAEVLARGARVVNLSLGGPTALDLGTLALSLVVSRASGRAGRRGKGPSTSDAVVVAAAGNEGTTQAMFPAALKGVVAVAALDAGGSPTPWTNRGPWVDCAALGDGVVGPHVRGMGAPHGGAPAQAFDGWARWSGTSFAAPHVAGRIAAALAAGAGSARVAAATVLASGQPLPVASGLGVRVR